MGDLDGWDGDYSIHLLPAGHRTYSIMKLYLKEYILAVTLLQIFHGSISGASDHV